MKHFSAVFKLQILLSGTKDHITLFLGVFPKGNSYVLCSFRTISPQRLIRPPLILVFLFPSTQSHLLRHVRDAGKQTFTSHDPSTLNTSRTWRTVDFFATDDSDGLGTLVDMYPDYFLSKRPITSVDQIPTVPEHIILNLQVRKNLTFLNHDGNKQKANYAKK